MKPPTVDEIRDLTDRQIEQIAAAWERLSGLDAYRTGRNVVAFSADRAGQSITTAPGLDELLVAVKHRRGEEHGLKSAVRWALLASTYPEGLTADEQEALAGSWNARRSQA